MIIDYQDHYDEAYWTKSKRYQTPNGERVYTGPSLEWDGFDLVAQALSRILPQSGTLLDIGCSSGDLIRRIMRFKPGMRCWGVDISKYAVEHAAPDMKDRVAVQDITQGYKQPEGFPESFDVVTAFDFMEHIYEEDLIDTWKYLVRLSPECIILLVATTLGEEFVLKKGEEVPLKWQETAISGHVNVRKPSYWRKFFESMGWVPDWEMMYQFAALRDMDTGWRNTGGWALTNLWILR